MEACRNYELLAIGDDGPDQLVLSEIRRHSYRKHSPLAARKKMRGLPSIGTAAIDPVIRADRNIEFLFRISIEVAEKQAERSVGILEPTFESAGNTGAGFMHRLER